MIRRFSWERWVFLSLHQYIFSLHQYIFIRRLPFIAMQPQPHFMTWDCVSEISHWTEYLTQCSPCWKFSPLNFVDKTAKCVSTFFCCKDAFGRTKWPFWPHSANWPEVEHGWFRPFTINLIFCISSLTKWAGGRSTLDFEFTPLEYLERRSGNFICAPYLRYQCIRLWNGQWLWLVYLVREPLTKKNLQKTSFYLFVPDDLRKMYGVSLSQRRETGF